MTELEVLTEINSNLLQLGNGLHFLMICVGAFLFWEVCKILYELFGNWFFG